MYKFIVSVIKKIEIKCKLIDKHYSISNHMMWSYPIPICENGTNPNPWKVYDVKLSNSNMWEWDQSQSVESVSATGVIAGFSLVCVWNYHIWYSMAGKALSTRNIYTSEGGSKYNGWVQGLVIFW